MKGVVKGLIIGGIIIGLGIVIILITLSVNNWSIADQKFDIETFTATENNDAVEIEIGAGTLITQFYDGDKVIIDYPTSGRFKTHVTESEGTVKFVSSPKWYFFGFGAIKIPETVIKLPQDVNFVIKADISAGTVNFADGNYKSIKLDISAGTLNANYLNCENFICDMSAGTANINEVICNTVDCEVSAGTLNINKITSDKTKIDMSAGTVKLGFTGNQAEYSIFTDISAGSCNVKSQTGNTEKRIDVDISAGSVKLDFNV